MVDRQCPQHDILGVIRVLVFVDQHVAEPVIQFGPHLGVRVEQVGHVQQQVVEVDRARGRKVAVDTPDTRLATTWLSGLPTRGSYLSAVTSLFLAALIAAAIRSGV